MDAKTKRGTDQYLDANGSPLEKRQFENPRNPKGPHHIMPKPLHPHHGKPQNNQVCNVSFVTPQCIRSLYDVPTDLPAAKGNSLGIVEYAPETYLQSDLDLFFETYLPAAVGEKPIFDGIDGGYLVPAANITNVTAFEFV